MDRTLVTNPLPIVSRIITPVAFAAVKPASPRQSLPADGFRLGVRGRRRRRRLTVRQRLSGRHSPVDLLRLSSVSRKVASFPLTDFARTSAQVRNVVNLSKIAVGTALQNVGLKAKSLEGVA